MSEILRDMLIKHEGLRLKVYNDSLGIPTIGIGRNLRDKGISEDEAYIMLDNDIKETKLELFKALPWAFRLDENRQAVLLNMAFNMGVSGLLQFKQTLDAVESGEYKFAAARMLESKWAKQVGNRATYLSKIMETGNL